MKLPRLARFIARHVVPRRPPDFIIGGRDNPYMLRWYLIPRNRVFNVYLHNVLRSDDDRALHDHPWPSLSLMLAGALDEQYRTRAGDVTRRVGVGAVLWRGPRFAHRLIVLPGTYGALTLFITGPKIREWGFYCPRGWRHWREFVAASDTGTAGKGCDP